jgi:Ser/Thr protein kinase RdoA (MazF antagonist)
MSEAWCSELAAAIETAYDVDRPVTCRFLRHGFNEHFRATAGATEIHVRVYLEGKYYIGGADDFRCELALTAALADAGCPVAAPIARTDGTLLSAASIGGEPRHFALLTLAPGESTGDLGVEDAAGIGRAVARIHTASDAASSTLPGRRYHLDERYLLVQPLEQLRRVAPDAPELPMIESVVDRLAGVLSTFPKQEGDYGLIHADFHLGNMHFTDERELTIFDFDHCANGWRAYDFAALRSSLPDAHWDAAIAAYGALRPLPFGLEHIDDLVRVRALWDVGDILAMEQVWGTDEASRQVRDALPNLCTRIGAQTGAASPAE